MENTFKTLIFDFDGVIFDSFDFHIKKLKEFTKYPLKVDEYRDMHNGNFFEKNNPFKNVKWHDYRDYIYEDVKKEKIKPEVKDTIIKLSTNYNIHIITSSSNLIVNAFLESNELSGLFSEILGFEKKASKIIKINILLEKYLLKKEDCIFITDTLGDVFEAKEAGLKTIALTNGFHERKRLKKGKPDIIIDKFSKLPKVIK